MDPFSISAFISGLLVAVELIVSATYKYCEAVKDANKDINQLCSESSPSRLPLNMSRSI